MDNNHWVLIVIQYLIGKSEFVQFSLKLCNESLTDSVGPILHKMIYYTFCTGKPAKYYSRQ